MICLKAIFHNYMVISETKINVVYPSTYVINLRVINNSTHISKRRNNAFLKLQK